MTDEEMKADDLRVIKLLLDLRNKPPTTEMCHAAAEEILDQIDEINRLNRFNEEIAEALRRRMKIDKDRRKREKKDD
jgi:hypothetical protein